MLPVIHHRIGQSVAVALALAGWLGAGSLWDVRELWQRVGWHLCGISIFFLLAVFLPERRKLRSVSRQGALQLMAFVAFLLASDLVTHLKGAQRPFLALALLLGSPFFSYFAGLFMIRGFRTPPQYATEPEDKPADETPAAVPTTTEESRVGSLIARLEGSAGGKS